MGRVQIYTGTSGWNYDAWQGPFYPEDCKKDDRLGFYGAQLTSCEVNNTFYRIPKSHVVEAWAAQVPEHFRFVLKCSRRVTHFARLKETGDESFGFMWRAAQQLGERRGPILFQLPPNARADSERLARFCSTLDDDCQAVFEFRHASWNAEAVHDVMREHNAALCWVDADAGDEDDPDASPPVTTADFGYLRLRRAEYSDADLDAWADRARAQEWKAVYVFFKHEDDGAAPRFAREFAARFANGES